jgi:hypothetical protein
VVQNVPAVTETPKPNASWDGTLETYVVENGKHAGKKMGDLLVMDPKYVEYLRAQGYDDVVKHVAAQLLDKKPVMPQPVKSIEASPAPTVPPITKNDGSTVAQQQPEAIVSDNEAQRLALAQECKTLVGQVADFKGPGLSRNFIPLLKSITGAKRLNYMEEWNVSELQALKTKLNEKLGNHPVNPHLSA